jgi:hypothetical protein
MTTYFYRTSRSRTHNYRDAFHRAAFNGVNYKIFIEIIKSNPLVFSKAVSIILHKKAACSPSDKTTRRYVFYRLT